ncbi:class I SAM-dependent methyltransferase [Mycolicibacillus parakoreensis]
MAPMTAAKHKVTLTGVSETALLTLNSRAREARRPDAVLDDPMAIALVDAIDFDFAKFGNTRQDMALRARAFDLHTGRYLQAHPAATVVALAEGLQTSFWRLDAAIADPQFRWITVDLPPVIELRSRLLPTSPRISAVAQSALDYSWMDRVDPEHGVFITAEGLLMYLQPEQALELIAACAARFPGAQMLFDLPPMWLAALTRRGLPASRRYRIPPMPFSRTPSQLAALSDTVAGVGTVHDLRLPPGRGMLFNTVLGLSYQLPLLDWLRGALTLLEFAPSNAAAT